MEYISDREIIEKWSLNKGPDGLKKYHGEKNAVSIDGLKALG